MNQQHGSADGAVSSLVYVLGGGVPQKTVWDIESGMMAALFRPLLLASTEGGHSYPGLMGEETKTLRGIFSRWWGWDLTRYSAVGDKVGVRHVMM